MKKIFCFLVIGIFLLSFSAAETLPDSGVSYCCEKTTEGAWCQNAPQEECDSSYKSQPTFCESTSYCKLGCCYDSQEGSCDKNTPQKVCNDGGGIWESEANCDIPQCELGCCLIGDQAAFVTPTRCNRLASLYGLEINFQTDITNEFQCILSATSDVEGACILEKDFEKTCSRVSQRECQSLEGEFHEGFLCSSSQLEGVCGPTEKTTCVEGKDQVYFVDSCGNLANVYDSKKQKDKSYWEKILDSSESCNYGDSNADSSSCGNCDYFLGSTCKDYDRSKDSIKPDYGDNICRDLSCDYEGKTYQHGESWCTNSKGAKDNLPGSRYFRAVCYNNEVTIEPCADFRQEICKQSSVEGFKVAGCIVNKWQDCSFQTDEDDCSNSDKRDCAWIDNEGLGENQNGVCIPKYAPGLDFWSSDASAGDVCSTATKTCTYTLEDGECSDGDCECQGEDWESAMASYCSSLGDCGVKKNYEGTAGYNTEKISRGEQESDEE